MDPHELVHLLHGVPDIEETAKDPTKNLMHPEYSMYVFSPLPHRHQQRRSIRQTTPTHALSAVFTDAPIVPSDAPPVPTDVSSIPIDAPSIPNDAPLVPSDAPPVPTDASSTPTDASSTPNYASSTHNDALIGPTSDGNHTGLLITPHERVYIKGEVIDLCT